MKRLIVSLLTICTLVVGTNVYAAESDFTAKINDLKAYGIIYGDTDGNLRLDDTLTRAETVTIICRLLNVEGDASECMFTDVEKDFWAAGHITAAFQNGLVDGCGNMLFKPNNKISQSEALKMIITTLGYTPRAHELGGYPVGYITVANEIGLLSDISVASDETITRRDIMNMVHTALDIPIMQQTSFGIDAGYAIMDGSNNLPLITLRKTHAKY